MDVNNRANESAKRAKQLSPSVQYAITAVLGNIMNGAFWGFTDMKDIMEHMEAIKAEPRISARKLGNACLLEVQPDFLLSAVQAVDPNALTQKDLNDIQTSMAEARISLEKFLLSNAKKGSFGGAVGIYCLNDVTTITYRGVSYPAFRTNMADTLVLLNQYGYEINVDNRFVPARDAVNYGNKLWESSQLSPTRTGIFVNIRYANTVEFAKKKEAEFKQKYGLK